MVGISIIGTGDYKPTKYKFGNSEFETEYFPVAFNHFCKPDHLFVLMTKDAKNMHANLLKKKLDYNEVIIPFGNTESEIWEIFNKIVEIIAESDQDDIAFDITHGFRSQPFIVAASLMYLKVSETTSLESILYGAYEARDKNTNIAPVFDLKSFIDLIEWANASYDLIHHGTMHGYKDLFTSVESRNSSISQLKVDFENITDAFNTLNVDKIISNASKFIKSYDSTKDNLSNTPELYPLSILLPYIKENFLKFSNGEENIFNSKGIESQKAIIRWYLETNQYQKALTLSSEYLITSYMVNVQKFSDSRLRVYNAREAAKDRLNKISQKKSKKQTFTLSKLEKKYRSIWTSVRDDRNIINHAGMNDTETDPHELILQIKSNVNRVIKEF